MITTLMPYLSLALLLLVWFSASNVNSELVPSPPMVYDRLVLLFGKPIMKLNLFGHIWASLKGCFWRCCLRQALELRLVS